MVSVYSAVENYYFFFFGRCMSTLVANRDD